MDRADIQRVALYRFAEQGYHATTLRHLAKDLGVTPAAFYYHFKSKDELLTSIIEDILRDDVELMRKIVRENETDPLDELIYTLVYGVCQAREESIIVEREADYLEKNFRKRVSRMVHEYERGFAECVAKEYDLSGENLMFVTRAVVGLGGSVMQWYRKDGPLSAHDVAVAYTRYAHGILERAERDAAKGKVSARRRARGRNGSGSLSFDDSVALIDERVAARRRVAVAS
jgi:AcrR family transcriptional regulator